MFSVTKFLFIGANLSVDCFLFKLALLYPGIVSENGKLLGRVILLLCYALCCKVDVILLFRVPAFGVKMATALR